MSIESRMHFQNMEGSPALEASIRKHVAKLARFYEQIIACDVTVEAPHHHHHKGYNYQVVIKVTVPGDVLVVSHEHGKHRPHDNCYVAIHDAFHSARRRLQDHARIRRHKVKRHAQTEPTPGQAEPPDEITNS